MGSDASFVMVSTFLPCKTFGTFAVIL